MWLKTIRTDRRSDTVNVDRLNKLMDRDGLAAVVVRGGHNVTYLSGVSFHGTLARHLDLAGSQRGVVVIWPRHGQPTFVIETTAAGAAEAETWISDLRIFNGYEESLFDGVAAALKELDLDSAKIGFDKNFVGAGFWETLVKELPRASLVDSTHLLDETRWIKTPAEVSHFRKGASLLDAAFAEVFPTIRAGEKETEVHGRLVGACLSRGAEFTHGIFNSHRNPVIYRGESDFVLQQGDIIRTDYLAYLKGYPGHQSRNAVIGTPSAEQSSDYQKYYGIYRSAAERLTAAVTAGEIYDLVVQKFAQIGWRYTAGLVGHSVGPWWHQQEPIFCKGSRVRLEPGMVIAWEPYLAHWHCQDLYLITNRSPELLSADFDTSKMFVIN
jgi:Xaa-Pro aminopeptidase